MSFPQALILALISTTAPAQAKETTGYPDVVSYLSAVHFSDSTEQGLGRCTGTFIHPRFLLTAAHCVCDFNEFKIKGNISRTEGPDGNPLPNVVARPNQIILDAKDLHPIRVHVSPSALPIKSALLRTQSVIQDLAILEFASDVAPATRPIAALAPPRGRDVLVVGFGHHGSDRRFSNQPPTKHIGRNQVHFVDIGWIITEGAVASCDRPEDHYSDWVSCGGDSGGPLLDADTGELIGVASSGIVNSNTPNKETSFSIDLASPEARAFIGSVINRPKTTK